MAAGTFTIQELQRVGATNIEAADGELFEWTSDRVAADPVVGGARACPRRPWTFGGELRTKRTDYSGARTPSEQVLGPRHKPFTLEGRFDDRYNFPGYAVAEMRRFEAMARRGNAVRISFQGQSFECLIVDWDFGYEREWHITYKFTVSTHDRPDDLDVGDRSPPTLATAQSAADDLAILTLSMLDAQDTAPASAIQTDIVDLAAADLATLTVTNDTVADTVDARESTISGPATVSPFARLASQFRIAAANALSVTDTLIATRSDIELGYTTAMSVLDYESWSRSLRFHARVIMGTARSAAEDLEERDQGDVIDFYRPFAGESLYSVSRRYYGTAHSWHLIAERNALTAITLTGDELLVIPERGRV